MEGFLDFVSIIVIVFGILQIILFFKLWGMTNDVKKIKEKFSVNNATSVQWEIRKCILTGDKEKAKNILSEHYIERLRSTISNETVAEDYKDKQIGFVKEEFKNHFKQLDAEMPIELERINSRADIEKIFHI